MNSRGGGRKVNFFCRKTEDGITLFGQKETYTKTSEKLRDKYFFRVVCTTSILHHLLQFITFDVIINGQYGTCYQMMEDLSFLPSRENVMLLIGEDLQMMRSQYCKCKETSGWAFWRRKKGISISPFFRNCCSHVLSAFQRINLDSRIVLQLRTWEICI